MATRSSILNLINLALGEASAYGFTDWGAVQDETNRLLELAAGEVTSVAVTIADVSLSDDEHNSLFIKATGALTGARAIETKDRKGFWFITNGCTGDYALTFKTDSGTGIVVPQGATAILASDGTNVLRIATLPSGGKAPGAATLQSKAAGFTAGVADNGNFFECTAALTMALKPAALLGADWACVVKATTGATVIDPDGAELVNGAATITLAEGSAALLFCTGTAFRAVLLGTVTLAGTESLTNKTLTNPTLVLKQGANPTPTAEGDIQWDDDDNVIVVGDGASQKIFVALPASTAAGDLLYLSGAKVLSRLAKGTAAQLLAMNGAATAPEWVTQSIDYGAGNAALAYGAVGTYVLGFIENTGVTDGSTYAGSSIEPAGYGSTVGGAPSDDTENGSGTMIYTKGGSALSGTWRAMGRMNTHSGSNRNRITLFLRTV